MSTVTEEINEEQTRLEDSLCIDNETRHEHESLIEHSNTQPSSVEEKQRALQIHNNLKNDALVIKKWQELLLHTPFEVISFYEEVKKETHIHQENAKSNNQKYEYRYKVLKILNETFFSIEEPTRKEILEIIISYEPFCTLLARYSQSIRACDANNFVILVELLKIERSLGKATFYLKLKNIQKKDPEKILDCLTFALINDVEEYHTAEVAKFFRFCLEEIDVSEQDPGKSELNQYFIETLTQDFSFLMAFDRTSIIRALEKVFQLESMPNLSLAQEIQNSKDDIENDEEFIEEIKWVHNEKCAEIALKNSRRQFWKRLLSERLDSAEFLASCFCFIPCSSEEYYEKNAPGYKVIKEWCSEQQSLILEILRDNHLLQSKYNIVLSSENDTLAMRLIETNLNELKIAMEIEEALLLDSPENALLKMEFKKVKDIQTISKLEDFLADFLKNNSVNEELALFALDLINEKIQYFPTDKKEKIIKRPKLLKLLSIYLGKANIPQQQGSPLLNSNTSFFIEYLNTINDNGRTLFKDFVELEALRNPNSMANFLINKKTTKVNNSTSNLYTFLSPENSEKKPYTVQDIIKTLETRRDKMIKWSWNVGLAFKQKIQSINELINILNDFSESEITASLLDSQNIKLLKAVSSKIDKWEITPTTVKDPKDQIAKTNFELLGDHRFRFFGNLNSPTRTKSMFFTIKKNLPLIPPEEHSVCVLSKT